MGDVICLCSFPMTAETFRGRCCVECFKVHASEAELAEWRDEQRWTHHHHIAPPGLQGILVLFVWIGALDRVRRIESMPDREQIEARVGLAQWLWLNGVRGEACWTWGHG